MVLLRSVNGGRWQPRRSEVTSSAEFPATALRDFELRRDETGLSVWAIEGDNLDSVIVAIAAERDRVDKLDYVTFDSALINPAAEVVHTNGTTPHEQAAIRWHYEVMPADDNVLANLAKEIWESDTAVTRIDKSRILKLLTDAVDAGDVPLDALKPKVRADVTQELERRIP